MARRPRIVIPGWVHHVTQRGNHQQTVFFSEHDRVVYLRLLAEYFLTYEISLIGYNLMDNHVHHTLIPEKESSLADGIGQLHHDFARWQNIQCGRNGHLWQNRFFSCPVEEDRVWHVLAYVELNPVRARMVAKAWEWEWSSAQAHATGRDTSGLLDMGYWRRAFDGPRWQEFLEKMAAEESVEAQIRRTTAGGYLLGSEATALRLERESGKQLLPRRRGRQPRSTVESAKLGKT
jgi:putative transposase